MVLELEHIRGYLGLMCTYDGSDTKTDMSYNKDFILGDESTMIFSVDVAKLKQI